MVRSTEIDTKKYKSDLDLLAVLCLKTAVICPMRIDLYNRIMPSIPIMSPVFTTQCIPPAGLISRSFSMLTMVFFNLPCPHLNTAGGNPARHRHSGLSARCHRILLGRFDNAILGFPGGLKDF